MCCCDVTSCCCGCNNLQKGTFIWAIIDAILNLIFFVATAAPLGGYSPTWVCFFMIFWDVLLALGAHFRKPGKAHVHAHTIKGPSLIMALKSPNILIP